MNEAQPSLGWLPETKDTYDLCYLFSQDVWGKYQKAPRSPKSPPTPRNNTFQVKQYKTLSHLYRELEKLSAKPNICHISGYPTQEALGEIKKSPTPNKLKLRRNQRYFSLFDETTSAPYQTKLAVIDLDIKAEKTTILSNQYKDAYREQCLSEDIFQAEISAILSLLFEDTPVTAGTYSYLVRKSSSMGVSKTPMLSAHIYLPLDKAVPIDNVKFFLARFPYADSTYYSSGCSILYTSEPDIKEVENPLIRYLDTDKILKRITITPGKSLFPVDRINAVVIETSTNVISPDAGTTASSLPGNIGAVNRSSLTTDSPFNVENLMTELGYVADSVQGTRSQIRYQSPTASDQTNKGGCIYYMESGYIWDTHENSPISEMFAPKMAIHPYQLHYALAKQKGTLKAFRNLVKQVVHNDASHLEMEMANIRQSFQWIPSSSANVEEHDQYLLVITTLLEDIYHAALPYRSKQALKGEILKVSYTPPKGTKRLTRGQLEKTWTDINRATAAQYDDFSPMCAETYNASLFLAQIPVYADKEVQNLIISGYENPFPHIVKLDGLTADNTAAKHYLYNLFTRLVQADEVWTLNQKMNIVRDMMLQVLGKLSDPTYKAPAINTALWRFSLSNTKAYDVVTGKVISLTAKDPCMYELPFTEEEYYKGLNRPIEDTYFHQRLLDTYKGKEYRVELVRDLYTSAIIPAKPPGIIYSIYGQPRSMKSSITGVLRKIVGTKYCHTSEISTLASRFALGSFTPYHHILEVTEFNKGAVGRNAQQEVINKLLSITGADGLSIERKGQDAYTIRATPCVITVGNDLPTVHRSAWIARQIPIRHEKSFSDSAKFEGQEFQSRIREDLATVFLWAVRNPRYNNGILKPYHQKGVTHYQEDQDDLVRETDILHFLCNKHLKEDSNSTIAKNELYAVFCKLILAESDFLPDWFTPEYMSVRRMRTYLAGISKVSRINSQQVDTAMTHAPELTDAGRIGFAGIAWKNYEVITAPLVQDFHPDKMP